jgi:hypothetical protein
MSKEKFVLFVFLLVAAVSLFVYLQANEVFYSEKVGYPLVGVMTTLFIVSGVELLPELVRWLRDISIRGKFTAFFGEAVLREDVRLVFPHRKISPEQKSDPFVTHYKPPQSAAKPVPEGVNGWLAFQDVRAAVYVTNTLSEMTNKQIFAVHDKDVEADPKHYCVVSFGLGFTGFTHYAGGLFKPSLFEVKWDKSSKNPDIWTDHFTLGGKQPEIPTGCDIAIVARIVPRPEKGRPKRVWFICAGRTAAGTAAAGYFLAKAWEQMHSLYHENGKDLAKDSMVVVIQHAENINDGTGGPEYPYDETAELVHLGEKKQTIVNWGRAAGMT